MVAHTIQELAMINTLLPCWPEDLLPVIGKALAEETKRIVILDDDPTGTQTAQNIPVLTSWDVAGLTAELSHSPAFFILTNSRSLPEAEAVTLAKEIGSNLAAAAAASGKEMILISRSDSTLRGHFPQEVDAIALSTGKSGLAYLLLPFFLEGGRYTVGDIHYVREGDRLIPAAQTPFARDAAFGYRSSDLKDWVAEKTGGRIAAHQVHSISLERIRSEGPEGVARALHQVPAGCACIVNCAHYRDLEVVVAALLTVEAEGKEFLLRTAASFVRTRLGFQDNIPLLAGPELCSRASVGGLFVVGSYVEKSGRQLAALLAGSDILGVEVDVEQLLDPDSREQEIAIAVATLTPALAEGRDVVLYSSRKLVTGSDSRSSLAIGQLVSDSLIAIFKNLPLQPRYLVAKGGITSSDVATRGLGVQRAMVLGQVQPGVPVWRLGLESRFPGMSYVVYPGNVGDDGALLELYQSLRRAPVGEKDAR